MAKLTPKSAVHKHERAMHKGQPLTKMKDGGPVKPRSASATGNRFGAPSKSTGRERLQRDMTATMAGDLKNERSRNQLKQDALKRGDEAEIRAVFGFKRGGPVKKGNMI